MEVHPPEHAIHNWRDFLVHMGTITLGLLIALSLEGLVEYEHHRHLVHTAHENLRSEMQANSTVLQDDEEALNQARRDLTTDLQTLRQLAASPDKTHAHLTASWAWNGLSDSGYNTARATGAFAYMAYDDVQRIDFVYTQQHLVDHAATHYIDDLTRIHTPLQGQHTLAQASPAEIGRMIDGCSSTLIDIELLQALMRALHGDYKSVAAE